MNSDDSVTHWFEQVRDGDSIPTRAIWERYFPELVRLARAKLRGMPQRMADEEDIAASVMESLFRAVREGRFPDLADRHDLWRLLMRMTARKVIDLRRREGAQRRGGESSPIAGVGASDVVQLAEAIGNLPTPEFAAMMTEEVERLLQVLPNDRLREVATAKMEGFTNQEIANRFGCSLRTIERELKLIRHYWKQ